MKLVVLRELRSQERRVAATPDTVKHFCGLGLDVMVEQGAGAQAHIPDSLYQEAGAQLFSDRTVLVGADIVLKVQRPISEKEDGNPEPLNLKKGALLIGLLDPRANPEQVQDYASRKVMAASLELLPRITRAQSMDVLSSQSNLAGYKAVIDAAAIFGRAMPMMMTAAGTVAPAKVFVLGAGVAGLQAIATARRLGAVVSATDVRPIVKEQVESLGAKFVMVESEESKKAETASGYAREMSTEHQRQQADLVARTLEKTDIAICTALIPGRRAPVLIKGDTVNGMKQGSVIVDLATEQGGNCEVSRPDEIVEVSGVKVVGYTNMASRVASDASALYARNIFNFLKPLIGKGAGSLNIDWDDEIVKSTFITRDGAVVNHDLEK